MNGHAEELSSLIKRACEDLGINSPIRFARIVGDRVELKTAYEQHLWLIDHVGTADHASHVTVPIGHTRDELEAFTKDQLQRMCSEYEIAFKSRETKAMLVIKLLAYYSAV